MIIKHRCHFRLQWHHWQSGLRSAIQDDHDCHHDYHHDCDLLLVKIVLPLNSSCCSEVVACIIASVVFIVLVLDFVLVFDFVFALSWDDYCLSLVEIIPPVLHFLVVLDFLLLVCLNSALLEVLFHVSHSSSQNESDHCCLPS